MGKRLGCAYWASSETYEGTNILPASDIYVAREKYGEIIADSGRTARSAICTAGCSLFTHFAEMFVATTASAQQKAAKNWAARLLHSSHTCNGFHVETPYITWVADVTTTPRILV